MHNTLAVISVSANVSQFKKSICIDLMNKTDPVWTTEDYFNVTAAVSECNPTPSSECGGNSP